MAQTPRTWDDYVGDGVEDTYQVTFPYQKAQEVFVTVDGEPVEFTFISEGWVQLAAAPASGAAIRIQRSTEAFTPRHEFENGVPLLPRFIDENNKQFLYVVQEAVNETAGTAAEALAVAEEARDIAQAASDKVDAAVIESAHQLRLDLANNTDLSKGAALVARGLQTFDTVAAMVAAAASIKVGQSIATRGYYAAGDGGGARYIVEAASSEPSVFHVALGAGKLAVLQGREVNPLQVGYKLDASGLDTPAKVAANWAVMKAVLNGARTSGRKLTVPPPQKTLRDICADWLASRIAPIGFYSDSTTDGATTTGHVPSTGSDSPFRVTINESPNAYPAKVEEYLKLIIGSDKPVRCYNGGFDSQSFQNGFGLKHWYNTWFRGLAGSNVDWSDVKMIVIGFGTSDSINQNDPGAVLDAYAIDVECVIVDCLLRGVTPVLQGPVLTTQKVGSTVNYRNGDESITLIETMQLRLCERYGLEHLSYREEVERMVSGYSGMQYTDYMNSVDMVHPTDMGHRIHAGYLISRLFPNLGRLRDGADVEHLFAGHNAYIPTYNEIIAPPSRNGLILRDIVGVRSDDSYFYTWREVDGNGKAPGALLLRIPVYVDRPTNFYLNDAVTNAQPAARTCHIVSCTLADTSIVQIDEDRHAQPARTWNKRRLVARLPYGLSIISFYAGGTGGNYQFVSTYLVDALRDPHTIPPRRPSAGTGIYAYKSLQGYDVPVPYVERTDRAAVRPWDYYNMHDGVPLLIRTQLLATPSGTYGFRSHYQDGTDWRNCYNQISITGDVVTLSVVSSGASTTVDTQTITGLGALMVEGARILLRFTTRFATSQGVLVELLVNGVVKYTYSAALGVLWPDGYGFGSFNLARTGEIITSARSIPIMTDVRFFV